MNPSSRAPVLRRRENRQARSLIDSHGIRPPSPEQPVDTLSGGNAQKILVARALEARPRVLILTEPTLGIDVGTRAQIYDRIRSAAAEGTGVLLVSSDYEEVAQVATRAVVLTRGLASAAVSGPALHASALTTAVIGGHASTREVQHATNA